MDDNEDRSSLLSIQSGVHPSPVTLTKLVTRLRALTIALLPVEADPDSINDPTSRIITPQVVSAYIAAAGDFVDALPYCLLRARRYFMMEANRNPADYGENFGRAIACEVLARRVVHICPQDRRDALMSTRFRDRESDGDDTEFSTALELAIDSYCTIFLSSNEAQDVVNDIWSGVLVQTNSKHSDIAFVPYVGTRSATFRWHLNPSRLSVPRYQNIFRIVIWFFFLVTYCLAVREPLEKLNPAHQSLDEWEIALYIMSLAFSFEDFYKIYKLLHFVTWRALTFWNFVSFVTDVLLICAFVLRIIGLAETGSHSDLMRLKSFQVLSFVSPLIWMKLVTIFDGYKYMGTMQICIARMLRESGIFFALLSLLGIGFAQGLYALDAADGEAGDSIAIINILVQSLLQSPNYDRFAISPAGLTLFYLWNVATAVILLNILISLFSSAYSEVVEDAEAEFLTFFAGKTVSMIRAPDEFVYPAPFNLIELFIVAPFELIMDRETYAQLNRGVMSILFFIPMVVIALHESALNSKRNSWMGDWVTGGFEFDDTPEARDPDPDGRDADMGLKISKVSFKELIEAFPDTTQSSEATILKEIRELKEKMDAMAKLLE